MNTKHMSFPSKVSRFRSLYNNLIQERLIERRITDLHTSYGNILFALYKNDKQTMKSLASSINRDKSTLTVIVRKLEKRGYVTRVKNPQDYRSKLIELTHKGIELKPIFLEISTEVNEVLWGSITETEADELSGLLDRVITNISSYSCNIND